MAATTPTQSSNTAVGTDILPERLYLDTRGYRCPLPVLKTRKRLALVSEGEMLTVIANDPAVYLDMTHFCLSNGHHLENWHKDNEVFTFHIRKGLPANKGDST